MGSTRFRFHGEALMVDSRDRCQKGHRLDRFAYCPFCELEIVKKREAVLIRERKYLMERAVDVVIALRGGSRKDASNYIEACMDRDQS